MAPTGWVLLCSDTVMEAALTANWTRSRFQRAFTTSKQKIKYLFFERLFSMPLCAFIALPRPLSLVAGVHGVELR